MRTLASFRSAAFNTSEPRAHFVNPGCYGDDLTAWLGSRLNSAGVKTNGDPRQEDFGWYLNYEVEGASYCFVVGYRSESESDGTWVGWVERDRGLLGSLFGKRKTGISPAAVLAIHAALSQADEIHDLRWHDRDMFDKGHEEEGVATP